MFYLIVHWAWAEECTDYCNPFTAFALSHILPLIILYFGFLCITSFFRNGKQTTFALSVIPIIHLATAAVGSP